ncbi:hypothetical protein M408DRAFT_206935 [Serendipita vermifera MAFF 305830]|uniref:SWIM-type domain-containing protein n=2 Tax=Serendipita vermifera MAFF 305830 TaxID=933852 RepID=A0A0C3A4D5_SERVB|nr:hypothetical protein M408DRAFT_206935 [Serendipita vermifera MAFF 305830]
MAPKRKANDELPFDPSDIPTTTQFNAAPRRSRRQKKDNKAQSQHTNVDENGPDEASNKELKDEGVDYEPAKAKKRKGKQKAEPAMEKRLAIFKKKCPQIIQERVERVKQQRFYMIGRERLNGDLQETFKVLGSTGNVYTVTIAHVPKCDCPDAIKGNHCKHLIFVFFKIFNLSEESSYYYQKALLTTELQEIFATAPPNPALVASQRVVSALKKATGAVPESSDQGVVHPNNKRHIDGENCPVCYEEMDGKTEAELSDYFFCDVCLNGLHADCFKMWARKTPVTCVYCRAPVVVDAAGPGGVVKSGGYVNLAREAGVSRVRDKSTYYYGPIKGRKRWDHYEYADD